VTTTRNLDTVIQVLGPRIECFIVGTAAAAEIERELAPLKKVDLPTGFVAQNTYRTIPFLVSKMARPDTLEVLYREPDGSLNKAMAITPAQFEDYVADALSEAIQNGDGFR
jgi:hypothetical protein